MKIYQIYKPHEYSEEQIIFQTTTKELAEKILEKLLKLNSFVYSSRKNINDFWETWWSHCKTDEEFNKKLEEKYDLDIRSSDGIMLIHEGDKEDFAIREVEVLETFSPDIIIDNIFNDSSKTKEYEDKLDHFKNMVKGWCE